MIKLRTAALLTIFAFFAGCTPNVSPDTYSVGTVGQVNRAVRGEIISARSIKISGSRSGVGATGGAAGGAVAGSAIGGGTRSNVIGAIGGAVVGGIAGAAVEEGTTRQTGMEYVIQTENGALLTITQGNDKVFRVGEKVLVLYGTRARVIANPRQKKNK